MSVSLWIKSIEPEEIDLPKYSHYFSKISENYGIACTAEYLEDRNDVSRDEIFEIAAEVREAMDDCDEYNSYEGEFIEAIIDRRKKEKE